MAVKTNLLTILTLFAQRQNSAHIHFAEFTDYMRRYAQHHISDQPELVPFLANPESAMQEDLIKFEEQHSIIITNPDNEKKGIIVIPYYVERYASRYREIMNNSSIPFPLITDLPKQTPLEIVEKKQVATFLIKLFDELPENSKQKSDAPNINVKSALYGLVLPHDIPVILLPSTIPVTILFDIALAKIRQMLRKEEFHDYFLKKLKISNPGKELSVKTFFTQLIQKPAETLDSIKTSGESFYFWSQLCFYIRKDYEKVKNYTQEDTAILQSVYITEYSVGYYKNRTQQDLQRNTALRNLEQVLDKPPYYFSKKAIELFTDSRGIPLLGQYSAEELNEFLQTATTAVSNSDLPSLLTFKIHSGQRYYIYKSKVLPLIVRLSTDTRETIKSDLTKTWFELYEKFDSTSAMSDQKAFEKYLENEVKASSPILYALLNSSFLSLVYYDTQTSTEDSKEKTKERGGVFSNGKLLPYSELFMISRHEISTDAKILLPFWFTIPIVSWITRLIIRPPKVKREKTKTKSPVLTTQIQLKDANDDISANSTKNIRRQEFRAIATEAEAKLVPPGSTIDLEMHSHIQQWNRLLDKQLSKDLTEDVNSLVRDYIRKTLRTVKSSSFTLDRIQQLADTLMTNPAFQKIADKEHLKMYIVLYIVKIIKNL